jgi:hypothetical protein
MFLPIEHGSSLFWNPIRVKSQYSILWLPFILIPKLQLLINLQALLESHDRRVDGRMLEPPAKPAISLSLKPRIFAQGEFGVAPATRPAREEQLTRGRLC